MEELKKENKALRVVILILCFAVGFGAGYYAVDLLNNKNKVEEKEIPKDKVQEKEEDSKEETIPAVVSTIDSIDDYPTASDNTVTSLGEIMAVLDKDTLLTNFKDNTKTVKGSTLNYNCEEYGEVMIDAVSETMGNACKEVSVSIDNKFTINVPSFYGRSMGCSLDYKLYKTDKYYIYIETEGCGKTSTVSIYSKNGSLNKQIGLSDEYYTKTITNWYFRTGNNDTAIETPISFVNKTMYYIKNAGRIDSSNNEVNLEMRSVDLTKDSLEEKVIDSFSGYVTEK